MCACTTNAHAIALGKPSYAFGGGARVHKCAHRCAGKAPVRIRWRARAQMRSQVRWESPRTHSMVRAYTNAITDALGKPSYAFDGARVHKCARRCAGKALVRIRWRARAQMRSQMHWESPRTHSMVGACTNERAIALGKPSFAFDGAHVHRCTYRCAGKALVRIRWRERAQHSEIHQSIEL